MTGFALLLTQALGCSDEVYDVIRVAGLLHDVGKIGIPDSILCKPGKLTEDEKTAPISIESVDPDALTTL